MAFAHHGTANYDTTKSITVKGSVTNFQFINPHVIISLDAKDDKGIVQNWQGGLTSPNHLMRTGWTKDTLKPGDVITISGFPAKSGAPEMWIQKVVASKRRHTRYEWWKLARTHRLRLDGFLS